MVQNFSALYFRTLLGVDGMGKIPRNRAWQPIPVLLPGDSHGQRNLVGYSPWHHKDLDTTEQLSTHTHKY